MSEKLLTISVAAYNAAQYLENTLKSLEIADWLDRLEVFVIDDGGSDQSLQIATRYQEKYPDTFHAIHKENGGYGSTIAYSIAHAGGKYFKLLDGDDWFDQDSLIKVLKRLTTCEEDVVVTDYYMGPDKYNMKAVSCHHNDLELIDVADYETEIPHGMWAIFYKTELLKESGIKFPLHTLYTDQIYATVPFAWAKRILFLKTPVYCYRFGREEQSTSAVSRIKHADDMLKVCEILYNFYENHNEENNRYLLSRIARYYLGAVRTLLLFPVTRENKKRIHEYETVHRENYPEVYHAAGKGTAIAKYIYILRKSNYHLYWLTSLIPDRMLNF